MDTWAEQILVRIERTSPEENEALRRALLQRVADRLAFAREMWGNPDNPVLMPAPSWRCCWVTWRWRTSPPYQFPWHIRTMKLCDADCPHWHHATEILMA